MTLILSFAFLFYISSQKNKERSDFQDHLFILMSNLQTESIFADSYLSKMEEKNSLQKSRTSVILSPSQP